MSSSIRRESWVLTLILVVTMVLVGPAYSQECVITFDGTCPNAIKICGATFNGGQGCLRAGLSNCYTSGLQAYRVDATATLVVDLDVAITDLSIFFAHSGSATGTMRFFDSAQGGSEVSSPLITNGNCGSLRPPDQTRSFSIPVWRIEVEVNGSGSAWLDSMILTLDSPTPVQKTSWGLLKAIY